MIFSMKKALIAGVATLGFQALATVDSLMPYVIPYNAIQTNSYCLLKQTMWAEIGIPSGSLVEATFADSYIYQQRIGRSPRQVNMNLLTQTKVKARWVDEDYDRVPHSKVEFDLRETSSGFGNSINGRQQTINMAKLAIIALNKGMSLIHPRGYKLDIKVIGLPSQSGLSGTEVYPTTRYPFTASSPLLKTYYNEVINREGGCM